MSQKTWADETSGRAVVSAGGDRTSSRGACQGADRCFIMSTDRLRAAQGLIERGVSVIPIGLDKKPVTRWAAFQEAHATPDNLRAWFGNRHKERNIGIVTGRISGLVVVDAKPPDLFHRCGLAHAWSPQQIAGWLRRAYPDDPSMHVSHETIYLSLFVQSRGVLKKALQAQLRQRHTLRRPRSVCELIGFLHVKLGLPRPGEGGVTALTPQTHA